MNQEEIPQRLIQELDIGRVVAETYNDQLELCTKPTENGIRLLTSEMSPDARDYEELACAGLHVLNFDLGVLGGWFMLSVSAKQASNLSLRDTRK